MSIFVGLYISEYQPDSYKTTSIAALSSDSNSNGMGAISKQFGGLAAIAGVGLDRGGAQESLTLAILNSRKFTSYFINKYQLKPYLFAFSHYDIVSNEIFFEKEIYDKNSGKWYLDGNQYEGPSDWLSYNEFRNFFSASINKETGFLEITVSYYSPIIAKLWSDRIISELNIWMKRKSISESRSSISYLNKKLEETKSQEMKTVFYQLIEEQTKSLMLAEIDVEYALTVIDPAVIPDNPSGPKRLMIVLIVTSIGVLTSLLFIFLKTTINRSYGNGL
ncbi:putative Lipopolysaccharide biosynthesis protein [Vibrio nigripulchritudo MADA3029]|nr:putative Lipopolysaccharide biosynthesis protein [Vibrio nigripulchritudo MADA3020]CCN56569.1 putative Lipopolysaccharide biosynthesis protein [Vibrio nigripulchritudo MADA3021]CCN58806.1 putative Lipopolysaccharide biosynthesis protein [Vibrio nigripulchritudo MADA3029]